MAPLSDYQKRSLFFKETVAELLIQSVSLLGERYDALVVDEGQDFSVDWWLALDELLSPSAVFHCFYDTNQAIFQDKWEPPFSGPIFGPLLVNCRNKGPIGEMARELGKVTQDSEYRSIDGIAPNVLRYKNGEDMQQQVNGLLQQWTGEGGLQPCRHRYPLSIQKRKTCTVGR